MSTLRANTLKPITSGNSLVLQGDSGGSGVSGPSIDSNGDVDFSQNTNAKIKLPSAGGIYESDGSTQVLTESGGSVTIQNATFNGTIGSSATFPSNSVIFLGKNEVTSTGASDNSSSGAQDTGLEISISDVSAYSKIIIQAVTGTRIDSGSYNLALYRLHKTAPSSETLCNYEQTGLVADSPAYQAVISLQGIDDSLGSGTHTYKVQYARIFASNVVYLGASLSKATILAFGVV